MSKINVAIQVPYQAAGATSGLTDVTMQIWDETGSLDAVDYPDVTMTELGSSGEYVGSFTPDALGNWRVVVNSATKPGQVTKQYEVTTTDVDTVATDIAGLNNVSTTEVNAEVDQALADYNVAKTTDIVAPPMIG